ncbi:hypothetical protein CRUP_021998 [Coryphaenoides rupestris]|nr:hypothetical protein CRUP_021998 [Coryphaenoides rupestris]
MRLIALKRPPDDGDEVLAGRRPAVVNAFPIGRQRSHYDIHTVVRYQCAEGFLQRHVPTAKCRANGKWGPPQDASCTKSRTADPRIGVFSPAFRMSLDHVAVWWLQREGSLFIHAVRTCVCVSPVRALDLKTEKYPSKHGEDTKRPIGVMNLPGVLNNECYVWSLRGRVGAAVTRPPSVIPSDGQPRRRAEASV